MCGLTGFLQWNINVVDMVAQIQAMATTLTHRGPDDGGVWTDAAAGIALGHRRLAVLDLTPQGHQPMLSADGRYVLVFNGEIYNHAELRKRLDPHPWRGHSDTEVLLQAIASWGLEAALRQSVGMFALALWDRQARRLFLARDRFGEKPLYYGLQGGAFLFASELKALRIHSAWRGEVDRAALAAYLRYAYVPTPFSIYQGIRKLPPGTWLEVDPAEPDHAQPQVYWSAVDTARSEQFTGSAVEAQAELQRLLQQSLQGQRLADVPLGVFLSGGIDSSLITALLAAQTQQPIQSFTIGFREQAYDEAPYAAQVARHLGTEHHELYVTDAEARAVIPDLPAFYDEPFADSSQIPMCLVSRLARGRVTVALSGDGGDELFGGYNRYTLAPRLWRRSAVWPDAARGVCASLLQGLTPTQWDHVSRLLPRRYRPSTLGDKLHKLSRALSQTSPQSLYRQLISQWDTPSLLLATPEPESCWLAAWEAMRPDIPRQMMLADTVSYLPDDILVKVDRAAMATSLETRAPFLDHRVFEFAWRLQPEMKIRAGQGKWLLRQMLSHYVPNQLLDRPKQGFGVPIDSWLRGPLRAWAEGLLEESRLRHEGWLQAAPIRRAWKEHLSGQKNWQHALWVILMFQAWQERWR